MSAWKPGQSGNPQGSPPKVYEPDLVERVRSLYESGLTQSEVAASLGITQKVVWRLMRSADIPRRTPIKRDQRGPANHMWKGDGAGYKALHMRVRSVRGAPGACVVCGERAEEWANVSGRYGDPADYQAMCRSHHVRFDSERRALSGARTVPEGLRR